MDQKMKKCWNCEHYSAYYTKKLCHFEKEDCGFCRQQGKITDKHHTCERWCFNGIRRQIRKNVALILRQSQLFVPSGLHNEAKGDKILTAKEGNL